MKSLFRATPLVALLWFGSGCFLFGGSSEPIEITLLHTNDIHSHLKPNRNDPFALGGLARLATALKTVREGKEVSLTLDAGDWSEGSWHYNIDTGANLLRLFDQMEYDAVVVGNHDYMAGPERLMATVDEAQPKFPVLASNLDLGQFPRSSEFRKRIPEYAIIEKGGVKFGVIGLTTADPSFSSFLSPITVTVPFASAIQWALFLRPQVDVLLLLSHELFDVNVELARLVPGVDAVISGHSHLKLNKARLVQTVGKQIPVVESGEWGRFFGELTLTFDPITREVKYSAYQLHAVSSKFAEDEEMKKAIGREDDKLNRIYDGSRNEVVAETEVALDRTGPQAPNLGDLAAKSYRHALAAEIGLEVVNYIGVDLAKGAITVTDIHDVMPHNLDWNTKKEWRLIRWNAKGSDLETFLKITLPLQYATNTAPLGFFAMDGLQATWERDELGIPKLTEATVGGVPLDRDDVYGVAMTEGMLLAFSQLKSRLDFLVDLSDARLTDREAWRAILDYSRHHTKNYGKFTAEGLRENGRTFATGAEPAVYAHGIRYNGVFLTVEIWNEGLSPVDGAMISCSTGLLGNSHFHLTPEQIYSRIGEAQVPSIPARGKASVILEWNPLSPGLWPVKCEVTPRSESVDAYSGDNSAERVIKTYPRN